MDIILCTKEAAEDYLMHYRRGGEKKGVRRWQNKDGSYTPAGYKHYAEMYGWGQKRNKSENDNTVKSIRDIEDTKYFKKIEQGRAEIDEIDKQMRSLDSLSNSEWAKKYAELDNKHKAIWNEIEKNESKLGITSGEVPFTRDALDAVRNKEVIKDVQKALSDDEDFTQLKKDVHDHTELEINQNKMFYSLLDDYEKKHGSFDGDGTEAHWKLTEEYPEYAKLSKRVDEYAEKIKDSAISIANKSGVSDLKCLKKYRQFFDKIVDPSTGDPWYKIGNLAALSVAVAAGTGADYAYVYLNDFIQSYDKNGKLIK